MFTTMLWLIQTETTNERIGEHRIKFVPCQESNPGPFLCSPVRYHALSHSTPQMSGPSTENARLPNRGLVRSTTADIWESSVQNVTTSLRCRRKMSCIIAATFNEMLNSIICKRHSLQKLHVKSRAQPLGGRGGPDPSKFGRTTPTFYVAADCSARNWVYYPYFVPYNNLDQGIGPPTLKTWLRPWKWTIGLNKLLNTIVTKKN